MKPVFAPPPEYYEHFKTRPVVVKPFDERSLAVAADYVERLRHILCDFHVEIIHRGSTALRIAGKGDIELGVYPTDEEWSAVVAALQAVYGPPGSLEENFARFNDTVNADTVNAGTVGDNTGSFDIEIILLRGYEAQVDRKLHAYLRAHPELCAEYERVKRQYCYSRRAYQRQKDIFLSRVVESIPEES